jgi:hypothetical protein
LLLAKFCRAAGRTHITGVGRTRPNLHELAYGALSRKPALIAGDVLPKSCDYGCRALPENQISSGFGSGVDLLGYHQLYFSHRFRAPGNDFRHSESDNLVGFDCEPNERYKHAASFGGDLPLDDNAAVAAEFPQAIGAALTAVLLRHRNN